jgi:hypothetical protein
MSGSYTIGGENASFASFAAAAFSLGLRGVNASTSLMVNPGTYEEAVELAEIPGAGEGSEIIFTSQQGGNVSLRSPLGNAVLTLNGADHIVLSGIEIDALGACSQAVLLKGGACSNLFCHCTIQGSDSTNPSTFGVVVQTDSNNSNSFKELAISGFYTGIALAEGSSPNARCTGNKIRNCTILNARYAIHIDNQTDCEISENDIQPGAPTSLAAPCYGVYVTSLGYGGSARVWGNHIHHFADNSTLTTNRAVAVYCAAAGGALVEVYNNFIYDFDNVAHLKISAIYLSAGTNHVWNNSILLGNPPTTNETSGIYVSTGEAQVVQNNIVVSFDSTTSYAMLVNGGSGLLSDYNDFFGTSSRFRTGRIISTDYANLTQWQSTGSDTHSIAADPSFVSSTDLHLQGNSAVDARGIFLDSVTTDIDGDLRQNPPDIGADEYVVSDAPPVVSDLRIVMSDSAATLIWTTVSGAVSYHIYSSATPDVFPDPAYLLATVTASSYSDTQAIFFQRRYYLVTADATSSQSLHRSKNDLRVNKLLNPRF